jgi:hypothetical protein
MTKRLQEYIEELIKSGSLVWLGILLLFLFHQSIFGQEVLKGRIVDETNLGIPMAEVFVKDMPELRVRADVDGNYLMRLQEGEYYLVYQAMGFEPRDLFVGVKPGENIKNVQLFPISINELEEFTYAAKKSNPGREIIVKVVEKKDQLDFNQYPHRVEAYIKAWEKIDRKVNQKKDDKEDDRLDDVEKARQEKLREVSNFNLVEVDVTRNYAPPNKVKEFRNAYSKRGNDRNLYYTTTAKSTINFFKNILNLSDLNDSPIQSPISTAGILSYKYRLVEQIEYDDGRPKTHKIKIIPRSSATSTLEGYIWVQDSTWMVEKLDLKLVKGNLYIYDYFQVIQEFDISSDTLCVLQYMEMNYGVKYKNESSTMQTVVTYRNYDFEPNFPPKYFGNEVAVTTKEAYERDTTFWSEARMTPLSPEEIAYIKKRDSIENIFTRKEYLDSVDSVFNKVTFWKVVWFGIDHRNREKRTQWSISSIAGTIQPVYIAGPRVGPSFDYFKKWENEKTLDTYSQLNVGILNGDLKGYTRVRYKYDPFHFGRVGFSFQHDYDLIRTFDAFSQVLLRENFFLATTGSLYHDYELFNGFFVQNNFTLTSRYAIPEGTRFIRWLDDAMDNNEPPVFDPYNAFIADMTISYTPFQKYMREPYRKVILGSRWPTIYAYYEKGIQEIFKSAINHDYLRLGIRQDFNIGTMGTTSYHATSGKFLNSKGLREIDYKFHRRSDPVWFSNPLFSFQDLDTSLPTLDWYFEAHIIHHFNGALVNKIPYMKKTGLMTVVGGGYLYVPEHNWQHYELFAGFERVFKFSRRRLRVGLYGVISDGNQITPRATYKVSFALLDNRNMKFNF